MKWIVGKEIDEYIGELQRLGELTPSMVGKAIYEGAAVVADSVRDNIKSLPVREEEWTKSGVLLAKSRGVTKSQKDGLLEGFGIAKLQDDGGFKHVKLGMDGYNDTITKKYPKGQPNAMIARVVESGNSYHIKTPFIGPAVERTRDKCGKVMEKVIDEEINTIIRR